MNSNAVTVTDSPDQGTPENYATKVLIVDGNAGFREELSSRINAQEGFEVCGVANEGRAGLATFRQLQPDLVVADITLPGMDGLRMTQLMIGAQPSARVLIHSALEDLPHGLRALRSGARGYVKKGGPPSQLITAMRHVVSQGSYLSPKIKESLVSRAIRSEDRLSAAPLQWLVGRDRAVMQW